MEKSSNELSMKDMGTDEAEFGFDLSAEEVLHEQQLYEHNRRFQTAVLQKLDEEIEKAQQQIG